MGAQFQAGTIHVYINALEHSDGTMVRLQNSTGDGSELH